MSKDRKIRPALSSLRTLDILEFMARFPSRGFTISEIARATDINISSCHSVLKVLHSRGYLTRDPQRKTYTLGPALYPIGYAALQSQPMIARAKVAAKRLSQALDLPVLMTGRIADEMVGIISISIPGRPAPGPVVGQRIPLKPPLGGPFVAWAPQAEINDWIRRIEPSGDTGLVQEQVDALDLIRARGFQVNLASPAQNQLAALIGAMAFGDRPLDDYSRIPNLIDALDRKLVVPSAIVEEELYDVMLISAPIFDGNGFAAFCLCLGGFPSKLAGAQINQYADRLMRECLEIMRGDGPGTRHSDRVGGARYRRDSQQDCQDRMGLA